MDENVKPETIDPDREAADAVRDRIKDFDFGRASEAMDVLAKQAGVGPMATNIAGLAQQVLKEMNDEAKDIARVRAEAYAKADQRRQALEAQRAKEDKDADGVANEDDEDDNDPRRGARAIPNTAAQAEAQRTAQPGQPTPRRPVEPNGRRA